MGSQQSNNSETNNSNNEINNYENKFSNIKKHISDQEIEQNIRNLFVNNKLSPYSEYSFMDTLGLNNTNSNLDTNVNNRNLSTTSAIDTEQLNDMNMIDSSQLQTEQLLKRNMKGGKSTSSDISFDNTEQIIYRNNKKKTLNTISETSLFNTEQLNEINMIGGVNTSDIFNEINKLSENNELDLDKIISESDSSTYSDTSSINLDIQDGGDNNVLLSQSDQSDSSSELNTTEIDIDKFIKSNQQGGKFDNQTSDDNISYKTEDINVLNLESTSEIFPQNLNRRSDL